MRKVRSLRYGLCAVCLMLAACNTLEIRIEQDPAAGTPTMPPATATPSPAEPAETQRPSPAGLVFQSPAGACVADEHGACAPMPIEGADVRVAPDGTRALYTDGDLWLVDRLAGDRRNLTNMHDHVACCARWWPARPTTVVFGALPRELAPQLGYTGYLAAVDVDGASLQILDDQRQIAGSPALAPDGTTIAYGGGRTGWLCRLASGAISPFDPLDYGLAEVLPHAAEAGTTAQIGSPAWSPDGRRIAWVVADEGLSPEGSVGVAVFDLQVRSARLCHLHDPPGLAGWPPMPIWGADGRLVSDVGPIPAPVWSLDGRWLAFQRPDQAGAPPCLAVEAGVWETVPLNVAAGEAGHLVGWVRVP